MTYFVLFAEDKKVDDRVARKVASHIKLLITTAVRKSATSVDKILSLCKEKKEFDKTIEETLNKEIITAIRNEVASRK